MASTLNNVSGPEHILPNYDITNDITPRNRSLPSFNINHDLKMLELKMCMEREREEYTRVLTVLNDKLRESQEKCQHLIDSHAELTRELESEADDGWKEAKQWEERYNEIFNLVRDKGIELQTTHRTTTIEEVYDIDLDTTKYENGIKVYSLGDEDKSGKIADFENFNQFYKQDYDTFNKTLSEITHSYSFYVDGNFNDWINLKSPIRFIDQHLLDGSNRNSLLLLSYVDF